MRGQSSNGRVVSQGSLGDGLLDGCLAHVAGREKSLKSALFVPVLAPHVREWRCNERRTFTISTSMNGGSEYLLSPALSSQGGEGVATYALERSQFAAGCLESAFEWLGLGTRSFVVWR